MKKRIVSLALAIMMLVSSYLCVFAAEDTGKIKNIIYLIADGGGYPLYDFANLVKIAGGFDPVKFPVRTQTEAGPLSLRTQLAGSMTTAALNSDITDSAAAGTAMATGYKTLTGYLGVNKDGEPLANLVEAAESVGKATGLIATYEWMHATPAAFSAHTMYRTDYYNIYKQMENKNMEVVLGAGYGAVSEHATIQNAIDRGYNIIEDWEDIEKVKPGDKLWGNIADGSIPYDLQLNANQPNLAAMTEAAITALSGDPDGFFLMVEGSKVDSGGHRNSALITTSEYLAFDAAFKVALDFAKGRTDTVIICAPDHDTGGLTVPENVDKEVAEVIRGEKPTTLPWETEGHTGQNVGVWTYVPQGVSVIEGLNPVLGDTEKTRTDYVIDNTDLAPWCADLMGVDLDALTKELFVDVTSLGNYNPMTEKFTFNNGDKYVICNQAEYYKNGEKISTDGKVAIYVNNKFYVPAEVVEEEDWKHVTETRDGITGRGSAKDPFILDDEYDFMEFTAKILSGQDYKGKYVRQIKDIDLTGQPDFVGLDDSYTFAGTYDGYGKTIKLNINTDKNTAIFPNVTGVLMNVGTEGKVATTANKAAGIALSVQAGGKMVNSWSEVAVTAKTAGGLTTLNQGIIENSCFFGSLTGSEAYPLGAAGSGGVMKTGYYLDGKGYGAVAGAQAVGESDAKTKLADALNEGRKSVASQLGYSEKYASVWSNDYGYPRHHIPVPVVKSVTITPAEATINKGEGLMFKVEVVGENNPSKEVTWSIEGDVAQETTISPEGFLYIDENEKLKTFDIMAKSNQDGGKVDVVTITVGEKSNEEASDFGKDAYLIDSASDFKQLVDGLLAGKNYAGYHFKQTADIDISNASGFSGLGASQMFSGIYDGAGHTINININSQGDGCLFPYTNGIIMNLGVTGSVKNTSSVAAICRSVRPGGAVVNCWSNAYVEGPNLGSIVWSNYGTVASCAFLGEANGSSRVYNVARPMDGSVSINNYYLGAAYNQSKDFTEFTSAQAESDLANWLNAGSAEAASAAGVPKSSLVKWIYKDGKLCAMANEPNNDIILTIGKVEASVFGEIKKNDVAPLIRNGRTMLPARFVTEALGGEVGWDEEKREVTIKKGDLLLIITIDKDVAIQNGKEIALDSPAFIENGRTYTPVRLIAEALGAKVGWNQDTQEVTITK